MIKQVFKSNERLQNQAELMFRFQVQVPTTVNELALSAYYSLICYKLSDDGVSRLRLVEIASKEKSGGALVADAHCSELLKT